ncbi:MAG: winged helix-turn-helix domain-containing protein [Actinomycetaceae bacterium]|nr:winged helix-turn-helix domain-containing protein [Actinomycetaceae bacterium]
MTLIYTPETAPAARATSFEEFLAVLGDLRLAPVRVDVDLINEQVRIDGVPLALSNQEYGLLTHLAENSDRTVSRDELYNTVWSGRGLEENSRTVDAHIRRLRVKLGDADLISTVRGEGYRFNSSEQVRLRVARIHTLAA